MNRISHIRAQLGVTQSAMADALHVTQGNISHYERGQGVPPEVAKRLISFALTLGHAVSFDDIYGPPVAPVAPTRRATDPTAAPGHAGRQPPTTNLIFDTVPDHSAVVVTPGEAHGQ